MGVKFMPTELPGVIVCEPDRFTDKRGYFQELYQSHHYKSAGITEVFQQDNVSLSTEKVLRGLHYQLHPGQAKLVSVLSGAVFDVSVDLRRDSPTFGKWVGYELSEENCLQLFIPAGFAHGFCVISEYAVFHYKCSSLYTPANERGVRWDDPALNIGWPIKRPLVSEKDSELPFLADLSEEDLPEYSQ